MKRRFLAILLATAMVLGMLVVPAAAAPAQTVSAPSQKYEADVWYEANTAEQLLAYFTNRPATNGKSINRPENQGKTVGVRLMTDVNTKADGKTNQYAVFYVGHYSDTASERFPLRVVLDLNGHTITDTSSNNRMFGVYAGSKLVITNGTILANGTYKANGGTIMTSEVCDVTLDGVRLVSADALDRETATSPSDGGLYYANAAGAKLKVINSELEKTAGSVDEGGLIYTAAASTVTIENSVLKGGSARRGGSLFGSGSAVYNITDTTILGGEATTNGGNLYLMGTTNMTRTTVTAGIAGGNAGNIYFQAKPVTLTDCVIENGFAGGIGNNLFVNGGPITVNGGKIAGGFDCIGKATFRGAAVVNNCDYEGVQLSEPAVFDLSEGASIVVAGEGALSAADVTAQLEAGYILPCTRTALAVTDGVLTGSATDTGYCPHCKEVVTWAAYTAGTVASGHYYAEAMTGVNPGTVAVDADVVIDLRGKVDTTSRMVFTGNLSFISSVTGGGALDRVSESSTNNGPTLRGTGILNIYGGSFSGTATTGRGGNVDLYGGGTFNLYNGCLKDGSCTDSETTYTGGNLYIGEKATLNMAGGVITGGTSAKNAGNVEVYKGTLNMDGGVIMKGSATLGGNLYPGTGSTLVMNDGIVYGGKAATRGGNLYSGSTSATQTINGGWITGGNAGEFGGNAYFNNGKIYIYGGKIDSGIAKWGGGNIYSSAGFYAVDATTNAVAKKYANNILVIDGKKEPVVIANGRSNVTTSTYSYSGVGGNLNLFGELTLGNAVIYGGYASRGYGADVFIGKTASGNAPKLTVTADYADDTAVYFGHANNTNVLTAYNIETYGEPIHQLVTVEGTPKGVLRMENLENAVLFADAEGQLFPGGATVVNGEEQTWYANAAAAADACESGFVRLYAQNNEMELTKALAVDVSGKKLSVTGNGTLYGFDTENDDFEGFGTVTGATTAAFYAAPNGGQYIAVESEDGTSFHRLDMVLTNVSIRPSAAGVYYTAKWECDSVLAEQIDSYGMAVSAANMPGADFATDGDTLYTANDGFAGGVTKTGVLVENILKSGEDNAVRGVMPVFAITYAVLKNGETVMGSSAGCSLQQLLESIDRIWPQLSDTQKEGVRALYKQYHNVFRSWELYNITADIYETPSERPLKILTLGHSLAVDSGHMINLVAASEGYSEEMLIGTLYHSGCPLYRHVDNLEGDRIDYQFYVSSTKTPDQPPVILDDFTMKDAIVYDDWDIIVMQGGVWELAEDATFTNGDIQTIQNYVNQHKTNPNGIFAWHTPWAFATELELQTSYETQTGKSEAENGYKNGYKNFNNDRIALYEAIQQRVENYILTDNSFVYLIPSGTAFENAMSSYLTEFDLHRDYAHATDLGRVISAYTWYCTLTGIDHLDEIKLDAIPKAFLKSTSDKTVDRVLTYGEKQVVLEAVNNALRNPTRLTQSQYETEPENYIVEQPMMERPTYTLTEDPTNTELRETAVRAMTDMLSIQWSAAEEINYNKEGAVSHKDYHYDANTTYCGLPYADGQTNLYVWLEYYDHQTGRLRMEGDGQWLNANLGNTCAGSLMWAWSTVCDSLTGSFINTNMVYKNGCIPVGDYTFEGLTTINDYYEYGTDQICTVNGEQVMLEAYAKMLPADAVTSSTKEHAMMIYSAPVVVRNTDGTIDGANSYVLIQDQAAGTSTTESKFYEVLGEDGKTYFYTGRVGKEFTFKQLFDMNYVPVTTVEFAGSDPYAQVAVSFSEGECETVEALLSGAVQSNYPMSLLKLKAEREDGRVITLHTKYFNRSEVKSGIARSYKLSTVGADITTALEALAPGAYTVTVEVTAPNGEIFTPVSFCYDN